MRMRSMVTFLLLFAPLSLALSQRTEQRSDSKWSERIDAGHWVRASTTNGRITVRAGSGDRVEVTAVKRWRKGDPATVRVQTRKLPSGDVEVCELRQNQNECSDRRENDRRGSWFRDRDDDDVSVDFDVTLPRDVKVSATSVNGGVNVSGATSDVEATTVNGEVVAETSGGPITATTVNGSVHARVLGAASDRPMKFTTVNGSVTAELASNVGAEIQMTTVNGSLNSDFEMTMRGRIDPRNLNVHIGPSGGPRISITTVNGSVNLRRR